MSKQNTILASKVAEIWREHGGDAESFLLMWKQILEALKDIEDEK